MYRFVCFCMYAVCQWGSLWVPCVCVRVCECSVPAFCLVATSLMVPVYLCTLLSILFRMCEPGFILSCALLYLFI